MFINTYRLILSWIGFILYFLPATLFAQVDDPNASWIATLGSERISISEGQPGEKWLYYSIGEVSNQDQLTGKLPKKVIATFHLPDGVYETEISMKSWKTHLRIPLSRKSQPTDLALGRGVVERIFEDGINVSDLILLPGLKSKPFSSLKNLQGWARFVNESINDKVVSVTIKKNVAWVDARIWGTDRSPEPSNVALVCEGPEGSWGGFALQVNWIKQVIQIPLRQRFSTSSARRVCKIAFSDHPFEQRLSEILLEEIP